MRTSLLGCVAALLCAAAPSAAREPALAEPFAGLGAWVDIFDAAPWSHPERAVADMYSHGVVTLYLQTASSRPGPAVFRRDRSARFLAAAHRRGMRVVAWYLPPYVRPGYELERALRAIRFRSSQGEGFDAFALDIETAEGTPPVPERNRRLLRLSRDLRRAAGDGYPLGAIIPSPSGLAMPHGVRWWPDFPYRELDGIYDAFLPMSYYSYRGEGPAVTARDTRRSLRILRRETGDPAVRIHLVGGISSDSDLAEGRAFTRVVNGEGAIGASMYDHVSMGPEDWRALGGLRFEPVTR